MTCETQEKIGGKFTYDTLLAACNVVVMVKNHELCCDAVDDGFDGRLLAILYAKAVEWATLILDGFARFVCLVGLPAGASSLFKKAPAFGGSLDADVCVGLS